MVRRLVRAGVCAALFLMTSASHAHAASGTAVVIVHPANPVGDLSIADVQRVFRGDRRFWTGATSITLVFCKSETPELTTFRALVYGKQKDAFRSYWLQRVFRGESAAPTVLDSYEAVAQYVASHPSAVACVPSDRAAGVKVVTVGGLASDATKYALK